MDLLITPSPQSPARLGGHALKAVLAAFAVAALSDLLSAWLIFALPLQWGVDFVTALVLFFLLGRKWGLLPALVAEAIPGLYIFPFWLLTVASIAAWGTVRGLQGTPSRS